MDTPSDERVADAGRAKRDLDERDRERCPSHHLCIFPCSLSIFMLAVFEELYKYAEQPDDKIPISSTAR